MAFKTWTEEAFQKGFKIGAHRECLRLLKLQLETRFRTSLAEAILKQMESWSVERLDRLAIEMLRAQSLRELGLED